MATEYVRTLATKFTILERYGEGYRKIEQAFQGAFDSKVLNVRWTPTGMETLRNTFTLDGKTIELRPFSFWDLEPNKFGAEKP